MQKKGESFQMDFEAQRESVIEELLTFAVGENVFGIDIKQTLGINRLDQITRVYQAPEFVRGIINLRGQVVSVLDLAVKLGGERTELTSQSRIIIVRDKYEDIGLLVDCVTDVVPMDRSSFEPPPANLGGILGSYFSGVYRKEAGLIGILDVATIIDVDGLI